MSNHKRPTWVIVCQTYWESIWGRTGRPIGLRFWVWDWFWRPNDLGLIDLDWFGWPNDLDLIDFNWFGLISIQLPWFGVRGGLFEFWSRGSSSFSGPISFKSRWPFDLRARLRVLVPRVKSNFCQIRAKFLWGPKALGKRLARPVRFELQLNIDLSRMNGQLSIELNKNIDLKAEWLEFLMNF